MGKLMFDNIDKQCISGIQDRVESDCNQLEEIINTIVQPYCKDLDKYVLFIKDCLADGENPPTTDELDDFCLNLSTYIYFAGGMCEQLGIRDDISKAIYKEIYNTTRSQQETGTVADKDSLAELASQQELLTNVCYNRAYKILKSKVENAQELLSSVKKVLSHRLASIELTRIGGQ